MHISYCHVQQSQTSQNSLDHAHVLGLTGSISSPSSAWPWCSVGLRFLLASFCASSLRCEPVIQSCAVSGRALLDVRGEGVGNSRGRQESGEGASDRAAREAETGGSRCGASRRRRLDQNDCPGSRDKLGRGDGVVLPYPPLAFLSSMGFKSGEFGANGVGGIEGDRVEWLLARIGVPGMAECRRQTRLGFASTSSS